MSEFASLSPESLADRRRQLRRQRRYRNLQTLWRVTAVTGLTVAACWGVSQPFWLLRGPAQIWVEGNELLADDTVQSLVPLAYPQSVLAVDPDAIATQLQSQTPIAAATVSRHLFPPRLEVTVTERQPVAVTQPRNATNQPPGLLDPLGHWLPQESFTAVDPDWPLPTLTIMGYDPTYASQWPSLYATLQASPVPVTAVNWQDPNNLVLTTELGKVHIGAYNVHQLPQQLATLAQLRPLLTGDAIPAMAYLDLSDPENPLLQGASLDPQKVQPPNSGP
ncbi:MAG: FtsQ-type POTRA domain-containing protein [Leptolyngbya sp.]|nr:FtsQ-type POTRA domain-containing protein [Leptolyngbya sp.]